MLRQKKGNSLNENCNSTNDKFDDLLAFAAPFASCYALVRLFLGFAHSASG
jgi:hypothetical protein